MGKAITILFGRAILVKFPAENFFPILIFYTTDCSRYFGSKGDGILWCVVYSGLVALIGIIGMLNNTPQSVGNL